MKKIDLPYIIKINPLIIVFGALFIILIPFLLWASLTQIEQISRAKGVVIATSKTQEIQSFNEGIIEEIFVKEGEKVTKNQIIAKLNKTQIQASFESTKLKVAALEATIARLKAEVFNTDINFTEDSLLYSEFINSQKELYKRRKDALNDEINAFENSLRLAKNELNLNRPLVKTGDIGALELIRLERQVADVQAQIINKKNKFFEEAQAELAKLEEELFSKKQELADKLVTLEKTDIISPMDAIVNNILTTTKGAKVKAGDIIMELVPMDKLVIEAKLSPSDISFVKLGQKASVKLDPYDFSIFGGFDGKVTHISSDTIVEKTSKGDEFFFKVLVSLEGNIILSKIGREVVITPGMTGEVDIVTAERTVLTYLTKPIIKTLNKSFTER